MIMWMLLSCSVAGAVRGPTLHDFSAKTIDGVETPFSAYKGKPVLVLNVAAL